ncbi:glycosyltransferase [Lysinibacillus antri]|uniref:Glycosyltransferase n=1 Tax=Lysinibacillus antri TaxID=2498145 RepID=A0A3S0QR39_9BACI|nr:glycosyltransferase [Lysinibacillus antri]RUL55172.1 glycosyltransferase [Lysinibacillus antri]
MEDIMVSIHCATYNHEKYIAEAIESFVMQKVNFKFEILIHDDASTDRTAEIIRKYEKKYPDLIKPIYQTQNQRTLGNSVSKINFGRARGKYIAICEGDDYWTDPNKLQKQVDFLESHSECSLCVHGAYIVNAFDKKVLSQLRPSKSSKIFTVGEVIEGGGELFSTNSMVYPLKYAKIRPHFFDIAPVGDYPLAINLSLLGAVYYIDEFMSAYRTNVSGSWTVENSSSIEKKFKHIQQIATMLDEVNSYTNGKYETSIIRKKNKNQFFILLEQEKFKEAKLIKYVDHSLALIYRKRLILFLRRKFPIVLKFLKNLRRKWAQWVLR